MKFNPLIPELLVKLFRPATDNWYRVGEAMVGDREFLIQDPDGYLLRFSQYLGERPVVPAPIQ